MISVFWTLLIVLLWDKSIHLCLRKSCFQSLWIHTQRRNCHSTWIFHFIILLGFPMLFSICLSTNSEQYSISLHTSYFLRLDISSATCVVIYHSTFENIVLMFNNVDNHFLCILLSHISLNKCLVTGTKKYEHLDKQLSNGTP